MPRGKKLSCFFFLLAVISICANVFWLHSGRDFSPRNFQPPVEIPYQNSPIELPAGPYTYLGHGRQSIVFESSDKTCVLKLFYWKYPLRKNWYRHIENWFRFALPSWIIKKIKKKGEIRKLFQRYIWGFINFPKETALVYLHFSKTSKPIPVTLIDRFGKEHYLNCAEFPFVIQKKIVMIPEYLDRKVKNHEIEEAKQALAKLRNYFKKRIEMGFIDNPEVFAKNFGFFKDNPVQVDMGKWEYRENLNVEKEQEKVLKNLDTFIKKHYSILL